MPEPIAVSPRGSAHRRTVPVWVPAVGTVLLLAIGFVLGYYAAVGPLRRSRGMQRRATSVAQQLDPDELAGAAQAYGDAAQALQELNQYLWHVPQLPAPFVGSLPRPGVHLGVHINAQQLRATRDVVMPKPPRTLRVFLTGGSTAFGTGAPSDAATIGGYLERALQQRVGTGPRHCPER